MINKLILIIGLVGAVNLQCADRGEDSKVSENTGEVIVWNESRSEWGNDAVLMPGTRIGFKYGERVDGLINVGKVHWNSAIRVLPTGSRPASKEEREMIFKELLADRVEFSYSSVFDSLKSKIRPALNVGSEREWQQIFKQSEIRSLKRQIDFCRRQEKLASDVYTRSHWHADIACHEARLAELQK